jgi:hypothetical protein
LLRVTATPQAVFLLALQLLLALRVEAVRMSATQ